MCQEINDYDKAAFNEMKCTNVEYIIENNMRTKIRQIGIPVNLKVASIANPSSYKGDAFQVEVDSFDLAELHLSETLNNQTNPS